MRAPLAILLCLILCAASSCLTTTSQQDAQHQQGAPHASSRDGELLADEQLWDIYYEYLEVLKPEGVPIEREEHEKALKPRITLRDHEDNVWTYTEHLFELGSSSGVRMGIDGVTGELRSYRNRALMDAHPNLSPSNRGPKVKQTMTKAEVRELLAAYLVLNTQIELEEYECKLSYKGAYWLVTFQRQLKGVRFSADGIWMRYSEQHGLIFYDNTMFSATCDLEPRLDQNAIEEAADAYLEKLMADTGVKFEVNDARLEGPLIVNPGTLRPGKRPPLSELRKTRVGWSAYYGEKKPAVVAPGQMPRGILVFVDGITGDILGHVTSY